MKLKKWKWERSEIQKETQFSDDLSMYFICWKNIYPLLKNLSCSIRENVTIGRYKTWFLTWNEHVNQNLVKQLFLIQMIPKFYYKEVKIKVYLYYFRNNCLTPLHDKYRMISNLILRFTFTFVDIYCLAKFPCKFDMTFVNDLIWCCQPIFCVSFDLSMGYFVYFHSFR